MPPTPPAWTSIASGVNPGKHGIFSFVKMNKEGKAGVVISLDVKAPRIHEMVALRGLRAVCVNHPLTYPVFKLRNLYTITDWLGPEIQFHPKGIENYGARFKPYETYKYTVREEFLRNLYRNSQSRFRVIIEMMENLDWNLFWVVLSEPDHILHRWYEEALKGCEEVDLIFKNMDEVIKAAVEISGYVVIASDHGFYRYKYLVYVYGFSDTLRR